MTAAGWMIMLLSVGSVCVLLGWCVYRVLTAPDESDHLHGFEQAPPDAEDEIQCRSPQNRQTGA